MCADGLLLESRGRHRLRELGFRRATDLDRRFHRLKSGRTPRSTRSTTSRERRRAARHGRTRTRKTAPVKGARNGSRHRHRRRSSSSARSRRPTPASPRNPRTDFIFPTGRAWALDLDYPPELLARVPDAAAESFAGVANPFALGRLAPGERVLDLGCGAGTDSLVAAQMVGDTRARNRHRHDTEDALQGTRGSRRDGRRPTSSSSREKPRHSRSPTRASTSSSRTASSISSPTRTPSSPRSTACSRPPGASRSPT